MASKTDGKMVQYECEGDICQDEKIDALQLEVSFFSSVLFIFTITCSDHHSLSAVLLPPDQSAGISKDLLGK